MTLDNTINFFESLKNETSKKSEIKVYNEFIQILAKLKEKEFTNDQIQSIESELDSMNLYSNPENRKKYYRKALNKFKEYLRQKFSLTSSDYYTTMGIAFGVAFGPVLGILFALSFDYSLSISIGISIGIIIGLLAGYYMDSQAKAAGRVL